MRAVNLLPLDLQARKSIRHEDPAVVVGSALGVIVMFALAIAFYTAHTKAAQQQRRLTADRLELGLLSVKHRPQPKVVKPAVPITPVVPPPTITGQEATWLSAVETDLSQRIAWDRLLREVSLVMPDDVTLTSLTMEAPIAPTTVPGELPPTSTSQGFTISGNAFSYDSVARLLSRLALVPDLSDVSLTSTSAGAAPGTTGGTTTGVQFSIAATVKGAPAPPATTTTTPPVDTSSTTTGVSS